MERIPDAVLEAIVWYCVSPPLKPLSNSETATTTESRDGCGYDYTAVVQPTSPCVAASAALKLTYYGTGTGAPGAAVVDVPSAVLIWQLAERRLPLVNCCLVCKRWRSVVIRMCAGSLIGLMKRIGRVSLARDPLATSTRNCGFNSGSEKGSFLHNVLKSIGSSPVNSDNYGLEYIGTGVSGWGCSLKPLARDNYEHLSQVRAVRWSSDSTKFASTSSEGKLLVRKWGNRRISFLSTVQVDAYTDCCCFSPTGNLVAWASCCNNTWGCADITNRKQRPIINKFAVHTSYVSCLRFMEEHTVLSASINGFCTLTDITTGLSLGALSQEQDIFTLCVSPTNRETFLIGSTMGKVRMFDCRCLTSPTMTWNLSATDVNSLEFSSSGIIAAAGSDEGARVFDLRQNYLANTFTPWQGVNSLSFSSSGHFLILAARSSVQAWSVLTGRREWVHTCPNHISSLQVSPDGKWLLTGGWDCVVRLYSGMRE
ncbi:guanine nucleotide-binding protein, beta subunit [Pelomyxa schiedti]|nr:guanine nucleotide-binding protein, beta subunit [Pelomyxa schiedti]